MFLFVLETGSCENNWTRPLQLSNAVLEWEPHLLLWQSFSVLLREDTPSKLHSRTLAAAVCRFKSVRMQGTDFIVKGLGSDELSRHTALVNTTLCFTCCAMTFSSFSQVYVHLSNTVTHLEVFSIWICLYCISIIL